MHIPTHILSGWCVANLLPLSPRERMFAMLAASLPDLDGISIVFGERAYQTYHHLFTHNLPFAILLGIAFAAIPSKKRFAHRLLVFSISVFLVHLHLVMDYFGSGPFWPIYYLWPINRSFRFMNKTAWELFSWQNIVVAGVLLIWTILIAIRQRRTPIELIAPRLNAQWVGWLSRRRQGIAVAERS